MVLKMRKKKTKTVCRHRDHQKKQELPPSLGKLLDCPLGRAK